MEDTSQRLYRFPPLRTQPGSETTEHHPGGSVDLPLSSNFEAKIPIFPEVEVEAIHLKPPTSRMCHARKVDHHLITKTGSRNPLRNRWGETEDVAAQHGFPAGFSEWKSTSDVLHRPHQRHEASAGRLQSSAKAPLPRLTRSVGLRVSRQRENKRRVPAWHGGHLRSSESALPDQLRSCYNVIRSMAMVCGGVRCCLHPRPPRPRAGAVEGLHLCAWGRGSQPPHSGLE